MREEKICIVKGCNNKQFGFVDMYFSYRVSRVKNYIRRCESCYERLKEERKHPKNKSISKLKVPHEQESVTIHTLSKYSGDKFLKYYDRVTREVFG